MSGANTFKIGLVQMAMSADPAENLTRAQARIREAAEQGAQVICLPELFNRPYLCQVEDARRFDWAEPIPGPTTRALGATAKQAGVVIVASLFEKRAAGLYHNSVAVLDADGELLGVYRKMHIPDDPAYYEKFYFTPGDLGFQAFDTTFGRVGTLICWDQWFPEAARLTAMRGPVALFYPTAIGWHPEEKDSFGPGQRDAWITVQRGHAIANGVFVAAVNRVGHERSGGPGDGIDFWGTSFVCDPFGRVLAEASITDEETLIAAIDPDLQEQTRRNWPFLRDRRIDAYGDIERRIID